MAQAKTTTKARAAAGKGARQATASKAAAPAARRTASKATARAGGKTSAQAGGKASGRVASEAPARAARATGAKAAKATAAEPFEGGYTIASAVRRLGPPDPEQEAAVRAAYPDELLQREGALVASERIIEDGERLVSKALTHLDDPDPFVQRAARKAGLLRPLVALTADALSRLAATAGQTAAKGSKQSEHRQAATVTLEAATNHGRFLKRQTLERLRLVQRADAGIAASVATAAARAETPGQLAMQLTALATLVGDVTAHPNPTVRALAAAKGLDADDISDLSDAVEAIGQATTAPTNAALRESSQAVLDILDGLCLVLLDDLLRALRALSRATPRVRKPTLHALTTYFGKRGKSDDEPEEEPTPAPAPEPTPA